MSTSLKSGSLLAFVLGLTLSVGAAFASGTTAAPAKVAKKAERVNATAAAASSAGSSSKAKRRARRSAVHRGKAWLIPPPPAYMPGILPPSMLQSTPVASSTDDTEEAKPENPYKKYIYTPQGEAPEPVQTRKGVVTWHARN